ncbi:MAG: ParB/RepB/Spo0J family partition protein [Hyphomonadaceae bacterium]|nr:ParB/RepB/Spo0J family partition protein [Hyphomonadaceae bacterium]
MSEFAKPRGLGRGLSALLGEPVKTNTPAAPAWTNPSQTPTTANVVELPKAPGAAAGEGGAKQIPIDLVQRNPQQPRKHFGEDELGELAASIRAHGVLQPILVRPIAGGKFEIVAGERRWRAAQRAGLHSIPAVVRDLNEVEVLEIAIVENVQRTDLNPIEEAQGFHALIERFGRTQEEIAEAVGKSRPHIANMLRLLKLPEDLQDMVRDGRLSAGHARAILTAPDPRALALRVIKDGLNVREIERLAQQAKDEKHGPRVSHGEAKSADTRALEQSLSNALGLDVSISEKGGAGDVKIAFKTLEQLDDVIRRLRSGH